MYECANPPFTMAEILEVLPTYLDKVLEKNTENIVPYKLNSWVSAGDVFRFIPFYRFSPLVHALILKEDSETLNKLLSLAIVSDLCYGDMIPLPRKLVRDAEYDPMFSILTTIAMERELFFIQDLQFPVIFTDQPDAERVMREYSECASKYGKLLKTYDIIKGGNLK